MLNIELTKVQAQKQVDELRTSIRGIATDIERVRKKSGKILDFGSSAVEEMKAIRQSFAEMKDVFGGVRVAAKGSSKALDEVASAGARVRKQSKATAVAVVEQATALKKQTVATKSAATATKQLGDSESKLASQVAFANKIRKDTMTSQQKLLNLSSQLNALKKKDMISSEQAARAWELYSKGLRGAGTDAEKLLTKLKASNQAFNQEREALVMRTAGWKTLSAAQQTAILRHTLVDESIKKTAHLHKQAINPLRQYYEELRALNTLRAMKGESGMTEQKYQAMLAVSRDRLMEASEAERKRAEARNRATAGETAAGDKLRQRIALLQQEVATLPRSTQAILEHAKGWNQLTKAEQNNMRQLTALQSDMKQIEGLFRKGAEPIKAYEQRMQAATRALQAFRTSGGTQGINAGQFMQVQRGAASDMMAANASAGKLRGGLLGLVGGFGVANQGTAAFRATLMGANLSFGMFTSSTIVAATAAYGFSKALASTISVGMEFEYQFNRVAVLMATLEDVQKGLGGSMTSEATAVRNQIMALAESTQYNVLQVTEGASILARSGMEAADIYLNLGSVLDLAAVGMLEMGDAADIATAAMASFKLTSQEFEFAVDVLAATATKTKASVEDIGKSLSYIGPIANQAGAEFYEVSAALGVLADVNIRGSKAGTAMRRVFTNLVAPTKAGAKAFADMGIDIAKVTEDGVDLVEIFTLLRQKGAGIEELKAIFGQYALSAGVALTNSAAQLDNLTNSLSRVQGYAAKVRDELRNNLKLTVEELTSVWQALQATAFETFGPRLTKEIDALTEYLRENRESIISTLGALANGLITAVKFVVEYSRAIFGVITALTAMKIANSIWNRVGPGIAAAYGLLKSYQLQAAAASAATIALGASARTMSLSMAAGATSAVATVGFLGKSLTVLRALFGGIPGLVITLGAAIGGYLVSQVGAGTEAVERMTGALSEFELLVDRLGEMDAERVYLLSKGLGNDLRIVSERVSGYREELAKLEDELKKIADRKEEISRLANKDGVISASEQSALRMIDRLKNESLEERVRLEGQLLIALRELEAHELAVARTNKQNALNAAAWADEEIRSMELSRTLERGFMSERVLDMIEVAGKADEVGTKMRGLGPAMTEGMANPMEKVLEFINSIIEKLRQIKQQGLAAFSGFAKGIGFTAPNSPYGMMKPDILMPDEDETGGGGGDDGKAAAAALKEATKALTEYFEAYEKGKGSPFGLARELTELDKALDAINSGTPAAIAAMKEMGYSAAEAMEALQFNKDEKVLEYLGQMLGEIDPRFRDLAKAMDEVTVEQLSFDAAMTMVNQLMAENPELAAAMAGSMDRVRESIQNTTDGVPELRDEWKKLREEAAKLEVELTAGRTFDDLTDRYSKMAPKAVVESTLAMVTANKLFGDSLKSVRPEAQLMSEAQRVLDLVSKKLGLTTEDVSRIMREYGESLPLGELNAQNRLMAARIELTSRNAREQYVYNMAYDKFGATLDGMPEGFLEAASASYDLNEELARIEELGAAWDEFGEQILDGTLDYLVGIEDSWSNTLDSIKDGFKNLLKTLIKQALLNQINLQVNATTSQGIGGGGGWGGIIGAVLGAVTGGGSGGAAGSTGGAGWGGMSSMAAYAAGYAGPTTGGLVGAAGAGASSLVTAGAGGSGLASSLTGIAGNSTYLRMVSYAVNAIMGGGYTAGFSAGLGSVYGATGVNLSAAATAGSTGAGAATSGFTAGQFIGTYAPLLAGVAGAYYGWNRTEGSDRVGAAAAYGALGVGVTGTALGMAGGASLGTAAGAAFGGAGMAAAMSWIPIVGWAIALAAVVDYASGGKVFGTKFRPEKIESSVGIQDGKGFASSTMKEWRYESFKPWNPGSWGDKDRRNTSLEVPDALARMAIRFEKSMVDAQIETARLFRSEMVGPLIDGAFTTRLDFNKDGKRNEEGDETIATILGKQYKDITFEEFQVRMRALQQLSQVAVNLTAAQIGDGGGVWDAAEADLPGRTPGSPIAPTRPGGSAKAMLDDVIEGIKEGRGVVQNEGAKWSESFAALMTIAVRWDDSAEMFAAGVNFLVAAGVDMARGMALLDGATLAEITNITESYNRDNESLIETYIRLKASVALVQETMGTFGAAMGRTNEEFLYFSADLVEYLGGLDPAREMLTRFAQAFGDLDEMSAGQGATNRELRANDMEDLGLSGMASADEFIAAFRERMSEGMSASETADWVMAAQRLIAISEGINQLRDAALGTTETVATQVAAQIAAIEALGASEKELAEARRYGNMIIEVALDELMLGIENSLGEFEGASGPYIYQLRQIERTFQANIEAAEQLGASEFQLMRIRRLAELQTAQVIDALRVSIAGLVSRFNGMDGMTETTESNFSDMTEASNDLFNAEMERYEAAQEAIKAIGEYLKDLKVGDLSPSGWQDRLGAARDNFLETMERARAGDPEAMGQLVDSADTYLSLARELFGSTTAYADIYDFVTGMLRGAQAEFGEIVRPGELGGGTEVGGGSSSSGSTSTVTEEQRRAERYQLALQIAMQIGQLGLALDANVFELLDSFGVPMEDLFAALQIDLRAMDDNTIQGLQLLSAALGVSVLELLQSVDANFVELAATFGVENNKNIASNLAGLADFAEFLGVTIFEAMDILGVNLSDVALSFGIDIDNLSLKMVPALLEMATQLGVLPIELVERLGIPLTELAAVFGYNAELTIAENWAAMLEMARLFGLDVISLGEQLGLDFIDIRGHIVGALDAGLIATRNISEQTRLGIAPYLEAIRTSSDATEMRTAMNALVDYASTLPEDQQIALGPLFAGLGESIRPLTRPPMGPETELTVQQGTRDAAQNIDSKLGLDGPINTTLKAIEALLAGLAANAGMGENPFTPPGTPPGTPPETPVPPNTNYGEGMAAASAANMEAHYTELEEKLEAANLQNAELKETVERLIAVVGSQTAQQIDKQAEGNERLRGIQKSVNAKEKKFGKAKS